MSGIPDGAVVNVVREDPVRRGLRFAGTERAVFMSIDDGDHWQSLRRNMPATSIRDLIVKDEDLVVATHGRSFWILDDISLLRHVTPAAPALFPSDFAWRVRWSLNTDTPIPQEEPAGQNPVEGVAIDYLLPTTARRVQLEILSAGGSLVRRYDSQDVMPAPLADRNIPDYWIRAPQHVATGAGAHRLQWDARFPNSPAAALSYPIAAVYGDTPAEPRGPRALPGLYRVRLIVDGVTTERPLRLRMDPTVHVTQATLEAQHTLAMLLNEALTRASVVA